LLTHAPPKGIGDKEDQCHRGFKIFLWFLKTFQPQYMIHGHIHIYDSNIPRKSLFLNTTIINCYDHQILEFTRK
nr:metallophosphoesterase [Spirochaetaceae bacterium]